MTAGLLEWFAAAFVTAVSVASARRYRRDHARAQYAHEARARMPSPSRFVAVYAWIRWSTWIAGVGALLAPHPVWLVMFRSDAAIVLGLVVATLGFVLFVRSRRALGRHYSPCFDSRIPDTIVTVGPYARVRHPIYTANLTLIAGLALCTGSAWMLGNLVMLAYYYRRSAVAEEAHLRAAHPDYARVVATTGRFLPRLAGQARPR